MKRIDAGIMECAERMHFADLGIARNAKQRGFKTEESGPYYHEGPVLVTIYFPADYNWNLGGRKVEKHTMIKSVFDAA